MAVESHHHLLPFPSQLQFLDGDVVGMETGFSDAVSAAPPAQGGSASSRKRPRSVLGGEVDVLVLRHAERVRAELAERRRRMVAEAEACARRRMVAKEEEIAQVERLNCALEERIRALCVENQVWRGLAESNEAAARELRDNLEEVLAAAANAGAAEGEDETESCRCGSGNDVERESGGGGARCRRCGEEEATVILLPCRHLCLCPSCGAAASACPVCDCGKISSVHVNGF
ncbi:probable BOI-related E3 ubiquitin-protein ligase 3 [Zingiber officinale]|uniref:probable BOI-related E3 ubiquitin-protein ligase 3 n=1 Tax=Zingiber officinale TaxID=94328 RepID=UPI001C4D14DB|nr:probable BOI-related E3 ubiquitin-protein ligase 3 [Zingiber officinale]